MKKSILLPLTIHLKPHNKRWPDLLPPNRRNWLCMGILLAAIEIAALATVLDTLLISLTSQQQDQITLWWNGFFLSLDSLLIQVVSWVQILCGDSWHYTLCDKNDSDLFYIIFIGWEHLILL